MTVASLMTDAVVMVDPDERLDIAETLMLLAKSRHIPVVNRRQLVGVISLRDILAAELPRTRSTEEERWQHLKTLHARDAMSRPPVVAHPYDTLAHAAAELLRHRISSLPVVDGDELVGIVTSTDLLRHAIELARQKAEQSGAIVRVADLMTAQPLMIAQFYEQLHAARLYMYYEKCRHLPVLDGTRLVGILSDRDILGALHSRLETLSAAERLRDESSIEVGTIMTPHPDTITPGAEAAEAGEVLLERGIGALPVVDGGRLVGIVTVSDFLKYVAASAQARPGAHTAVH